MNADEKIAKKYLIHSGLDECLLHYEPLGCSKAPDFGYGDNLAIEVRRLNDNHWYSEEDRVGLEGFSHNIEQGLSRLLETISSPNSDVSWFVDVTYRRTTKEEDLFKLQRTKIKIALEGFLQIDFQGDEHLVFESKNLRICVFGPCSHHHTQAFVLGSFLDLDSGGFVVANMIDNIELAMQNKSKGIEKYKDDYSEYWLILVNRINPALSKESKKEIFNYFDTLASFDKVIIVNPLIFECSFELKEKGVE